MEKLKDFTQGSILKHIWALSIPTMIAFALQTSFNIVDTIFVGRLGADAIAAVSIVFPVVIFMIALGSGTGIGAAALVARYLGAKKIKEAGKVLEHTLIIALFFSIIFALGGFLFSKKLFILIGATPNVVSLAMSYSNWIFGFGGFIFILISLNNVLRGEGDAKTPMKYMIISILINTALDPLLIFGIWFFPALGVEGAAIATIIARGFACILLINHILKGKSSLKLNFKHFKYRFKIVKNIFSVGIPASLSTMLMSAGMLVLMKIVSFFGPSAIAAYGIGFRLESIAFHFVLGVSLSTVALVGHNFGAGNIKRAKKIAWVSAGLAMGSCAIISIFFLLFSESLASIFTKDILVLEQTVSYIKIASWFFAFIGLSIVLESAFQGFGRGMPKFILAVFKLGVLTIPLVYILSKNFGLVGIWYGIAIANLIASLITAVWFKLSKFEKTKNL